MGTRKIHFRRNKVTGNNLPKAVCATVSVNGNCHFNGRRTYHMMASEIVGIEEFQATPIQDRCAHCMTEALVWRNSIRKRKGLAPVDSIEGWGL